MTEDSSISETAPYGFMLLMLAAGTVNMLLLKFQHMQQVPMEHGGPPTQFNHPWHQALFMMIGELLCLPVYFLSRTHGEAERARTVPKWIFLVPCLCDLIATALLCMGLALIAVSVAQMCRGTIVVFVCAMSVIFLGRRQHGYHIMGVSLVLFGVVLVSVSAMLDPIRSSHASGWGGMAAGIACCVFAQFFQACMFVYEEKIMAQYGSCVQPLRVVGMEGLYGVACGVLLLAALQPLDYANTPGAVYQMRQSPPLCLAILGSMCAVALVNFAGATVTQRSSAVARTTIKISSTICIWIAELAMGWNTFRLLQLLGFINVAAGTLLYNRIVTVKALEPASEARPLHGHKGSSESCEPNDRKV